MKVDLKRVVIKVGTNVITNKGNRLVVSILKNLVEQIAELKERGMEVVLVTSGSVIAGKEVLGACEIEDLNTRRQVFSAIGQPRLMRQYYSLFHDYGVICAQVLATKRDFSPGKHRENMVNCFKGLLSEKVVPVVNEDDAVSVSTSMFSDNDELASLTAWLVEADLLIILSDIDGLFDGHPEDNDSKVISTVSSKADVEEFIETSEKGEAEGRGGMESKIQTAQDTAKKGIDTYIANGKQPNVILDIVEGKKVGTRVVK